MEGLDYLGTGEGLASQFFVVRIRKIDSAKLAKEAALGKWAAALAPALAVVDQLPDLAVDMAAPVIQQQLAGYGITADVVATNAPPPPRTPTLLKTTLLLLLGAVISLGVARVYHHVTLGAH
jgi:hypothetical protein